MTQVQVLGESWQRKNHCQESPFDFGRRVEYWRKMLRIFTSVSITSLVMLAMVSMITTGYPFSPGIPLEILRIFGLVTFLVVTVGLYKSTYSRECLVWDEFKYHHDTLVRELDIQGASTSLSSITDRTIKRLCKQSGKIRNQLQAHFMQSNDISLDEVNMLRTKVDAYWRFRNTCEYLGLIDQWEMATTSDELFASAYLDGVEA